MAAARQTTIGVFVFGGIVLALAAIVLFGNFRLFSRTERAAVVFQGSISGLSVGASVTFRGVRLGSVQSIGLQFDTQTQTAYIPVTLQLEPDRISITGQRPSSRTAVNLRDLVARGLRAELVTQSFVTGQSEVNLDFYPQTPAKVHPSVTDLPEIPARLSTVQRVQEELSKLPLADLVKNANGTLQSLQHLSDRLDKDLPALVATLQATAQDSSRTVTTADQAITSVQRQLNDTLTRATQLLTNSDRQITQRSADLHTVLVSSARAVKQADDTMNEVKALLSARGETRANLDSTLRDLASAAASLRGFASDVERNPQLLLTGRRP